MKTVRCLSKAGYSSAKLVGLDLNLARLGPERDTFLLNAFTRRVFFPVVGLFFEASGERDVPVRWRDSQHTKPVKSARSKPGPAWRVTSGAHDFRERGKMFGPRYLNQSNSENHPASDSKTRHSSVTRQACHLRTWRQVERRCCDCAKTGHEPARCCVVSVSLPSNSMTNYQNTEALAKIAGFKDYSAYLFSDHWRELRRLKGVRECFVCNSTGSLVVHHIQYRNLLDVGPADLAVMCQTCHDDFHIGCRFMGVNYIGAGEPVIKDVIREFRASPRYAKIVRRRDRKVIRHETGKWLVECEWPDRHKQARYQTSNKAMGAIKYWIKRGATLARLTDTTAKINSPF